MDIGRALSTVLGGGNPALALAPDLTSYSAPEIQIY
jgi:hypothetical protein